jgi:hypothetical protein
MKAQITPTKIIDGNQRSVSYSGGDVYVDLVNCQMYKQGTVLAIRDLNSGTTYVTDFAYTSVAAVLAAAAGTGGFFVLT